MCIGQWCFVRHYLPLVGGATPSIFLEHESHESIECRYKKRPWRLESHECILYDTPTVFLSVVIREIINTDGVSSQSSFVRFVRFVFFQNQRGCASLGVASHGSASRNGRARAMPFIAQGRSALPLAQARTPWVKSNDRLGFNGRTDKKGRIAFVFGFFLIILHL